jgi:hypothetical protein
MDELTREILTQIQGGTTHFQPANMARDSVLEFQATVKRIEAACKDGLIQGVRYLPGDGSVPPGASIAVAILGGLTLRGEQTLLDDPDDQAF